VSAPVNVAFNKPVTLNGGFPVYTFPGGPLCGTNPPQPAASIVTDGIFFPEGTCYQSGVYWDNVANSIDIDLQGVFQLTSAIVQADDNDTYILQYRDPGGAFHDWWTVGPSGSFGLITRPNSSDPTQPQNLSTVVAAGLRFFAPPGSGDGQFAVAEIQVFANTDVPEPSPFILVLTGIVLFTFSRLRRL